MNKHKNNKNFPIVIFLCLLTSSQIYAQKIFIRDINKKPVTDASVTVHVYYKAIDYLLHETKEKFFSFVTDTSGTFSLSGEFQKETYKVDSVSISVQHENYLPQKLTTLDYSTDSKFSYTIFLVHKKYEIKVVSMPGEEKNELDIYTTNEISKKLNIEEKELIKLIESKKIRAKKIGQKYFISGNDLRKYLEE